MAVGRFTAADDQLAGMFVDRLAMSAAELREMQTVCLRASGDAAVARNQRRCPCILDDRNQFLGMFLKRAGIEPVLRHDHRGDVAALQCVGDDICLLVGIRDVRDDQDKAAAVFRSGHGTLSIFSGFRQQAANPHSFCVSNSVRRGWQGEDLKSMLPELSFYYAAVPAVLLVGLAKGGMGDALAWIGVPVLALVVSPVEAAAILLPILIFMDMISLVVWRKHGDWTTLKIMLPGALVGIAVGWATSALVPGNILRVVIGAVTIALLPRYFWDNFGPGAGRVVLPRGQRPLLASAWGTLSGYGSFVAHAGGAPFQIYALPLKLPPREFIGTSVRFFAILNAVKLIPYFALGQLDTREPCRHRRHCCLSPRLRPLLAPGALSA